MKRLKIVGGGMTGILAAMHAHRLGARDIELHERLDRLGGVALPELRDGMEMREGCIYFGPQGNAMRALLEEHGATFTDFENRFGSVSPGEGELVYVEDFGGPAFASSQTSVTAPQGPTLLDRLSCYDGTIAGPALAYARWHLGCDPAQLHESAATPLAINRIYPSGADAEELAAAKQSDPQADELLAIPRSLWGRTANVTASLPEGGFESLLRQCRQALDAIGVRIMDRHMVTPRQALADHDDGEVLIWAGSPTPLFKAAGLATPAFLPRKFTTCVFKARWTGALPFYVQNFTAEGVCFRIYIYESAGQTLLTAECVQEPDMAELPREFQRMLAGFQGEFELGALLFQTTKPRWIYHTVETVDRLAELRQAMSDRMGRNFIAGAWEEYAKDAKFVEVNAALEVVLG